MKVMWRLLLLSALCASQAFAHPIHTTLTRITVGPHGFTLNVRAFADDFSATVAKFSGRRAPADSSVNADDVLRYVRSHFAVTSASGTPVVLEPCGITRAKELYWLCFRVALPGATNGARIRNQMLTELHADQVNIVQLEPPARRRTVLFTKGSAFAVVEL